MAKILLADDEAPLRMMMAFELKRSGHEVVTATDGLDAVEKLTVQSANALRPGFDVLVTDLHMPRLDGVGLIAQAQAISPQTEVVVLTSNLSVETAVDAFKKGNVFDYLLKPLEDIRELSAVVARAAERNHLRQENRRLVEELRHRVEELEAARRELTIIAERDGLTGLYNHRTIHGHLDAALQGEGPVCVLLLDMDGFKPFNDTYGHPTGDSVLRRIAEVLQAAFPSSALHGRCGGDEFMIVLPGASASDGKAAAEKARCLLRSEPFLLPDGRRVPLRLCFGIADTNGLNERNAALLVAAADAALYESKARGGDGVTIYGASSPATDAEAVTETLPPAAYLENLVSAVDKRDRAMKRHAAEVARYALLIARECGLDEEERHALQVASLLHDIGKIGVPDALLKKSGPLTQEEYEQVKTHGALSTQVVEGLPRLSDILDAVANHHERWDGAGYPKGVTGEAIPLLGRILAIADAYAAMTMERAYRPALPSEEALREIEAGAGTQFDPDLARQFVHLLRRKV